MMGLHLGSRMTVARLPDGGLLLHSPVPLTDDLRREIDALGPVRQIVCPNLFHHTYAGEAQRAYPAALLLAPPGMEKKRPDLKIGESFSEAGHPGWGGALLPVSVDGCMLKETVLFHPATRTLIGADLVENFETVDHLPTRLYLKASGIYGRVGWSRLMRFVYRDRAAARRSVERILALDFDRAIIAHGRPLERDAKASVRQAFTWL
jgi:hypothetical protein